MTWLNDMAQQKGDVSGGRRETVIEQAVIEFALNRAHDAAYLIHPSSRFLYVNDEAVRALGYSREELLGMGLGDIDPDFSMERWKASPRRFAQAGSSTFETRHRAKDGRVFPVEVTTNSFEYDGRFYRLALARDISERARASAALRESERRYREHYECSPLPYQSLDAEGRLIAVNQAWLGLFGYSADEVIGKPFSSFLREGYPGGELGDPDALKARDEHHGEYEIRRKDGVRLIVHVDSRVGRGAEGEFKEAHCILYDVTERVARERERRCQEHFFESLDHVHRAIHRSRNIEDMTNNVLDAVLAIFDCDRAWLVYPCDPDAPSWKALMFRTRPGYPGAGVDARDVPTKPDVAALMRTLLNAAGPVTCGLRTRPPLPASIAGPLGVKSQIAAVVHPKIGQPWVFGLHQCSHARIWTAGDQVLFQEVARRIEDSLTSFLSHRDLLAKERKYREIFDNVSESLFLFGITDDGRYRLEDVNPAGERLMGLKKAGRLGQRLDEIAEPDFIVRLTPHFRRATETGLPVAWEEDVSIPQGQRVLQTTLLPVRNDAGEIYRLIVFANDVTERKRARDEALRLNAELEHRVAQRTAALENANRELEAFSYSVSHDLRAPLRAISGFSRILADEHGEQLDDDGRHCLDVVLKNAQRMSQLIDDLLSFSHMSRKEIGLTQIDMGELAREVFEELREDAQGRNIRLRAEGLPWALADRAMMRQVLMNLLSNAIKFTARREVAEIGISGRVEATENVYGVSDNGAGFDMRQAGRLFGVFQRLHSREDFEGTGIGLAIVKRIVERHGGRVWAESKVGEGTSVYFTLPNRI